jgi:hypothetical protein
VGEKLYTEDWALVELYRKKIDWKIFKGNIIFLGMFLFVSLRSSSLNDYHDFLMMMYPYPKSQTSFKFPRDGLFQIRGVVKEEEIP